MPVRAKNRDGQDPAPASRDFRRPGKMDLKRMLSASLSRRDPTECSLQGVGVMIERKETPLKSEARKPAKQVRPLLTRTTNTYKLLPTYRKEPGLGKLGSSLASSSVIYFP